MNEIIKIDFTKDQPMVSARELYRGLGVTERFQNWFQRQVQYGFEEDADYLGCKVFNTLAKQELQDYQISIDMAKQICMLQRSEKGRLYRQYFLELEKAWNSPEQVLARALQLARQSVEELQERCFYLGTELQRQQDMIDEMEPKVRYLEEILQNDSLFLTTQIAKDYGMSARKLNGILHRLGVQYKSNEQWVLYAKYQGKGYAHSTTFIVKRSAGDYEKMQTEWTPEGRVFIYELLKEQGILPVVEKGGEPVAGRNHK